MTVPEIKTPLPGPKAQAIIDRDTVCVSSSSTRAYPLVTAKGEGSVIEDVDGNRFLDCAAGIAVTTTGHSHPDVVRVVVEQAGRYLHVAVADFYAEGGVRLAEALAPILPIDGDVRCFFSNSGTEAVEVALKLARYHTERPYLIAFLGAFHGRMTRSRRSSSSRFKARVGISWRRPSSCSGWSRLRGGTACCS